MDGVQLSQSYIATTRKRFTFYNSVPMSSWYSERWNAELTSEPPSSFEPRNPGLGIQRLNRQAISEQSFSKKLEYFRFHMDSLHLKFTKIWQTFTHTKESQKTSCFLYTVILIFTGNHICTWQRYMKS